MPFAASSFPEDAAWQGFITPASNGHSADFIEWQGKLVLRTAGIAGAVVAPLVAWDGAQFEGLPSLGTGSVLALGVWDDDLVVAIHTGIAAKFPILKLNGAVWDTLGVASDYVFAFGQYQGSLIVGGRFAMVNGVATSIVAAYDGNAWSAAGTGMSGFQVTSLCTHAGALVASGSMTPSVKWISTLGAEWQSVGTTTAAYYSVASDGTDLYAVGRTTLNGNSVGVLDRWDGNAWSSAGGPTSIGFSEQRLTHWNNRIVTTLRAAGAPTFTRISQWDGVSLTSLPGDSIGFGGTAFRVGTWGSKLVVTGNFSANGSVPVPKILLFDGTEWSTIGVPWSPGMTGPTSGAVTDMRAWDGKLIVSGQFPLVADEDHWLNHIGITAWDGEHWSPLGNGLFGQYIWLSEYQGDLIATGYLFSVRGTSITRIARWNGSTWSGFGSGAPDYIDTVAEFLGDLYVGSSVYGAMRWNGTSWSAMPYFTNGYASTVAASGSRLIVGGNFEDPGIPSPNVAFWDGASWQAAGAGVNGGVWAATDWFGQPVIAGPFTASGLTPLTAVAIWDGAVWQPMGTRAVTVHVLRVVEGELFASGSFRLPDDSIAKTVARWTGTDWHVLGSGSANYGYAFEAYGGHLYHAGTGLVHGQPTHTMVRAPLGAVLAVPRPRASRPGIFLGASPNPSRSTTRFTFRLPAAGHARLTIVDVTGRAVATLADGRFDAGQHQASWDASPAPGIYFARLQAPGGREQVVRIARVN